METLQEQLERRNWKRLKRKVLDTLDKASGYAMSKKPRKPGKPDAPVDLGIGDFIGYIGSVLAYFIGLFRYVVRFFSYLGEKFERFLDRLPQEVLAACQFSTIVISIFMLYFSLTAFMGLSFYADMTSQGAYTSMVNLTSGNGDASLQYGPADYNESCDFSKEIRSVEVPCSVLGKGTDAVINYVSTAGPFDRKEVVGAVAANAYRESRIASSHYTARTFMPVAVAIAGLSALLIALTTNTFVDTLRGTEVAVLSSGVALLAVKPLMVHYIAMVASVSSTSPSKVLVLASEISSVPPFEPHLFDMTRWAVGLSIAGAVLLAVSYTDFRD